MLRRFLVIALPPLLSLMVRATLLASPAATTTDSVDVATLINNLADANPAVRTFAARRLADMGSSVRQELMGAMETAGPQVRSELSQILLLQPWVGPADSADVQRALTDYGQLPAEERCQRVITIGELPDGAGFDALIRILRYDPSTAVRWISAQALRFGRNDNDPLRKRLRDLPIDNQSTNAPLLAAVGWAWHDVDAARTDKLLTQAVANDAAHPAAMNGQLDFAYFWLVGRAMDDQRFSDAVYLLRQQSARSAWTADSVPQPVLSLFALQAENGPFPGFVADLHIYRGYLNQPEMLYCLAHLTERQGFFSLDSILNLAALAAGGVTSERHLQAGTFLTDQGWLDAAERELQIALLLCDGSWSDQDVAVYFKLAQVAGERNDELANAQYLESALMRLSGSDHALHRSTRMGDELPWSDDEAWAEMHVHYLRAAQASGDMPALRLHLQKLLDLDKTGQVLHKETEWINDVVPALEQTGQSKEADKYFDLAYKDLSEQMSAHPDDPEAKNNLAWLCARCNRRLDEAIKLADQAVAAEPDNSAYLDTDAECHFRASDKEQAVKLESRALQLRPHDAFMMGQLQRFRGESPHVSSHP